ncbi:MAG: molybdopterin-dependent oxidoreductase, partial [Actinobacteria bacterium]|nr:molybdopterin-dependent oxidoreductase [Actinomycetota bacterium]
GLRWLWGGLVGLLLFGVLGMLSALTTNGHRDSDVVPTAFATAAAIIALIALVRSLPTPAPGTRRFMAGRRRFLITGGALAAFGLAGALGGRTWQRARFDVSKSRAAIRLPAPASPAPALPSGVELSPAGQPFVTPNRAFYRVDTALTVPQVDAQSWRLAIRGLVDRPRTYTFDELLRRPLIERYVTMTCVSNEVGGSYVSTAKFLGVRLADLLNECGLRRSADQIVASSVDGMTIGTPAEVILDGRDAMLAVGMNDEPLPVEHGFPVRMLVPGLYGYVSACKWLTSLEATTFAKSRTYWVQRGWAARAPIRLESRVDRPKPFEHVRVGQLFPIAGVAWYQGVGIQSVEVKIDDSEWMPARLGRVPSHDTWVQWVLPWTPMTAGPHTITVRATDANGVQQDQQRREPFPSGASGWPSVVVQADAG